MPGRCISHGFLNMTATTVESSFSLFDSANHVLDHADLVELVSGATLRHSPPSRMVTSSPILTTSGAHGSLTRPCSPTLESTFSILADQDHVVSQITLINGEKIWVREEKGPSWANTTSTSLGSSISTTSDDCNSSTDSINICVPLFVSTSNQVSELDQLSSEMLDLSCLLNSSEQLLLQQQTVQVLKPPQLVNDRTFGSFDQPKPGNSLLRSALTGKTSYLMSKQQLQQQQQQQRVPPPTMPTFKPGLESSKIGEQKVEEILLLAKKRSMESGNNNGPSGLTITATSHSPLFHHSDKLVINTANLLNTAASQLNLAPPSLSSLVPVRSSGDSNNNIKTIPPPPASVISLVVDVGNNNNNVDDSDSGMSMITPPGGGAKRRILKRQKSNSSGSGGGVPTANAGTASFISSFVNDSVVASPQEPRKEARLMHYCPICNKGFKDRYSVNVHVRTHTGEKPFSCAICGKCFRQKAHLAKHHQTHAAKQTTIMPGKLSPSTLQQQPPQASAASAPISAAVVLPDQPATSLAGNLSHEISPDNIVFPLSPVSVDIMDQS